MLYSPLQEFGILLQRFASVTIATLVLSTTTCSVFSIPFFNPLYRMDETLKKGVTTVCTSLTSILIFATGLVAVNWWVRYICSSTLFEICGNDRLVYIDNYESIFHGVANTYSPTYGYIWIPLEYCFFVELVYYIYHRLMHTRRWYRYSHYYHHMNLIVYPADILHADILDTTLTILCLYMPVFWVRGITSGMFSFLQTALITYSFLQHSDRFVKIHTIHHRRFAYNYCFCLPIFDWLLGTLSYD